MPNTPDLSVERGMPWDESAERSILGLIIVDASLMAQASSLDATEFALDSHRRIFRTLGELIAEKKPVEFHTIQSQLSKRKEVEAVGGMSYVSSLTDLLPRRASIANYVRTVKEKAALRQIIHRCTATIAKASEPGAEPEQLSNDLENALQTSRQWEPEISTENYFVDAMTFATSCPDQIDWTVRGIIPRGCNGIVVAEPKSLKSYAALDLLVCLSLGVPWLDFEVPRQMRTAILAREDSPNLTQWRLNRFLKGKVHQYPGLNIGTIENQMWINTRAQEKTVLLDKPKDLRRLIEGLKTRKIELLVMDVFRKLHGQEENDNTAMQVVLENINRIEADAGCNVVLIHHTNKGEGGIFTRSRGASAIHGWCEFGIALRTVNPDDPPEERVRKMDFLMKADCEHESIYVRAVKEDNWLKLQRTQYYGQKPSTGSAKSARELMQQ